MKRPLAKPRPQDHVVQFYRRDEELVARIAAYVAEALQAGGAAVILAAASRRAALQTDLVGQGVDLIAGHEAGVLYVFDAEEILGRFLVEGRPDPRRFLDVVGQLINEAGSGGRPVYVYGEMVAVLWEAGLVNAAIEVEGLWNELGRELPFSLFCAYPAEVVTGGGNQAAVATVCGMHSGVIGAPPPESLPGQHTMVFPGAADTPRAARHFVIDTLRVWGAEPRLIDNAALVVTELTTNAMMHAHSGSKVTIWAGCDTICVAVEDRAAVLPIQRAPNALTSSGRGLAMVAALSRQWGADLLDDGKVVWAELSRYAA